MGQHETCANCVGKPLSKATKRQLNDDNENIYSVTVHGMPDVSGRVFCRFEKGTYPENLLTFCTVPLQLSFF